MGAGARRRLDGAALIILPSLRRRAASAEAPEANPLLFRDTGITPQIEAFWDALNAASVAAGLGFTPRLAERVWVATRCIQLNAQMIRDMPLRYSTTAPGGGREPAWVTNPDPVYFPNGIGDAAFAATRSLYGHGDAFLYVTSRYADGFPSGWTVLDPEPMNVELRNGRRHYRSGNVDLDSRDVVQITRDPGGLKGTPALRAYASKTWGAISTIETARGMVSEGKVPNAVLKSQRQITAAQATEIQDAWINARARQPGAPAVLPPGLDFEQLAFSPQDLLLLDSQKFDATVICSAYGVPAYMLNLAMEGALIYQAPAQLFEFWWRSELRPMASTIASALSAQMLPKGSAVQFDATETIEPNVTDQTESWNQMLDRGVVTVNEFRAAVLGLPALEQGDAIEELTQPAVAAASPADAAAARPSASDLKVVTA